MSGFRPRKADGTLISSRQQEEEEQFQEGDYPDFDVPNDQVFLESDDPSEEWLSKMFYKDSFQDIDTADKFASYVSDSVTKILTVQATSYNVPLTKQVMPQVMSGAYDNLEKIYGHYGTFISILISDFLLWQTPGCVTIVANGLKHKLRSSSVLVAESGSGKTPLFDLIETIISRQPVTGFTDISKSPYLVKLPGSYRGIIDEIKRNEGKSVLYFDELGKQ
jgi:hypothetical protein